MITHDKTILDIFLFPSEASGSGVPVTEGWACLGKRGGHTVGKHEFFLVNRMLRNKGHRY